MKNIIKVPCKSCKKVNKLKGIKISDWIGKKIKFNCRSCQNPIIISFQKK